MRKLKSFLVVFPLVGLLLLMVLPSVALADDGGNMGRFSVFNSVTVAPGETVEGDVGSIFSSVQVGGHVIGNVFSIFSSVNLVGSAQVDGDVFSVFSSVNVSGNSVVQGDAFSLMSSINTSSTARVEGSSYSGMGNVEVPNDFNFRIGSPRIPWMTGGWLGSIFGGIFSALLLAAIAVVTVAIFPRRVENVKLTMHHNPWSSIGVGFLGLILSLPLALILLITCVGFFIVIIGTFLATLFGLVAIGLWVGERIMDTGSQKHSPVMDTLVGTLVFMLILAALNIIPFSFCFTWLIWGGLYSMALGGVLLSRFGSVPPVVPPTAVVAPMAPIAPMPAAAVTPPAASTAMVTTVAPEPPATTTPDAPPEPPTPPAAPESAQSSEPPTPPQAPTA